MQPPSRPTLYARLEALPEGLTGKTGTDSSTPSHGRSGRRRDPLAAKKFVSGEGFPDLARRARRAACRAVKRTIRTTTTNGRLGTDSMD